MAERKFILDSTKWHLLQSALNEILNGFALDDFDSAIGRGKEDLHILLKYLRGLPRGVTIELGLTHTIALRNALKETLRELGAEEFHSRTGYNSEDAQTILGELTDLIEIGE